MAGQVSLGHAFFMGVGAYTAVVLGGEQTDRAVLGLGLPMWIWLPAAGVVACSGRALVAPTAVRVRGLYLAFVTIALVFIGDHVFRNLRSVSGGPGDRAASGRPIELKLVEGGDASAGDFSTDGPWFGVDLSRQAKQFIFLRRIWRSSSPSPTRTSPAPGSAELSPPSAIATSPPR